MKIVVIAPHPDDETLGCGGTLLKLRKKGHDVFWLIVTEMREEVGFSPARMAEREKEIQRVAKAYGFAELFQLGFPTTQLDKTPVGEIVSRMTGVMKSLEPQIVFLPNRSDAHSDHRIVFEAGFACTKPFRLPSLQKLLTYETISETEFSPDAPGGAFSPNAFEDVSDTLEPKIEIMELYAGEMQPHPFPRSPENLRALATLRGASAGYRAAEAFEMVRELNPVGRQG